MADVDNFLGSESSFRTDMGGQRLSALGSNREEEHDGRCGALAIVFLLSGFCGQEEEEDVRYVMRVVDRRSLSFEAGVESSQSEFAGWTEEVG